MPILATIERDFRTNHPFEGLRVALSVHPEAKSAYLAEAIAAGGA